MKFSGWHGSLVLATTATGARDVVRPGVNGVLVEPGDVEVLASTIRRLSQDRAALADLREGARAAAPERAWSRYRAAFVEAVADLESSYQEG